MVFTTCLVPSGPEIPHGNLRPKFWKFWDSKEKHNWTKFSRSEMGGRKNLLGPTLLTCCCSEWKGMQFYTKHLLAFFKQNQTPRNAHSNHVSVSQASVYLPFLHHCTADGGPAAPLQNGALPASTASCCVGGTNCSCWGSAYAACFCQTALEGHSSCLSGIFSVPSSTAAVE